MTNDTPSPEQIRKTFGAEAVQFITDASALGWKVVFNSTGTSVTLISRVNEAKKIHLSSRNKGKSLRKFYKVLVKHASPEGMEFARALFGGEFRDLVPEEQEQNIITMQGVLGMADAETMDPEPKKERFQKPEVEQVKEKVAAKVAKERHIISERPALMHKSLTSKGGKSYPSKTTIERRWSDGTIDYACAVTTCNKTSDNRLSFRGAHWAMHVRNGEAQPYDEEEAKRVTVDDPSYTEAAWSRKADIRTQRKDRLANLLKGIDLKSITPEDLAEQIMEFLGDPGSGGGGSSEPLTDAQIIDRIRSLVDRGHYADQEEQIIGLNKQIEDLVSYSESREQELQEALLIAEQRATKAESSLEALAELVAEAVPKKEEGTE